MNIEQVFAAKEYPPTAEQRKFVETVCGLFNSPRNTRPIVVADAVAGAGKTATVIDIYNVIASEGGRGFFQLVAFNVDAKQELISRGVAPKHAKTLNGLGHANLSRFARSRGLTLVVDENKPSNCLRSVNRELFDIGPVRKFARSLFSFCKSECLTTPSYNRLTRLADHFELFIDITEEELRELDTTLDDLEREAFAWVQLALTVNNTIPKGGEWIIDFNDQVYLPVVLGIDCFQNDLLIVDEAQDLSIADKRLVDRCLKDNGVLVLVGDDYQCIYAWRGCRVNSLQATINNPKLDVVRTPLTYNFRSCKEIIEEAQNDCPHIECGTGRSGSVSRLPASEFDVQGQSGDVALLSRTRAPLIGYAIECLKTGTPFTFRFSLKFLVDFVDQVAGSQELQIRSFRRRLNKFVAAKLEQYEINGAEQAIEDLNDNVAILETIIDQNSTSTDTVGHLVAAIEKLDREIQNSEGALNLSTIHGSKGLEWDTTYLLGFESIGQNCYKDWKLVEARNLRLVARTRAKNNLIYLEDVA